MSENRTIAKNSLILYSRLFISTILGLYLSRVILLQLGADDFGLYTVVGGVVTIINFIGTTMVAASNRFIAVEIGKGRKGNVNNVFNTALLIHIVISIIFILLIETIGIWYVKSKLNISSNSIENAIYVLQLSAISTLFYIISIPYQSFLIARERFSVKASIEIFKLILKLVLVFTILAKVQDKLRAYAQIMVLVMLIPALMQFTYCKVKEKQNVRWKLNKRKEDYVEMLGFTWWIMIGAVAHISVRQGVAIILNLFFGTIINAAFGIASQVYNYIMLLVSNLNQAFIPQIMKSQTTGDENRSLALVYIISRYAFFVMLIPAIPILLSIDQILVFWLKEVPKYTKEFAVIMIVNGLISCFGSGFNAAIQATGKIQNTQLAYSILMLAVLPVSFLLLKLGYPPYIVSAVTACSTLINLIIQIKILTGLTEFDIKTYCKKVIIPNSIVCLSFIPLYFIRGFFGDSLFNVAFFTILAMLFTVSIVLFIGLEKKEKDLISTHLNRLKVKL